MYLTLVALPSSAVCCIRAHSPPPRNKDDFVYKGFRFANGLWEHRLHRILTCIRDIKHKQLIEFSDGELPY